MRTTITLDPDVALLVQRDMAARKVRFKQSVNDALRRQLAGGGEDDRPSLTRRARSLGTPTADLTRANQLAADLEDEEIVRKMAQGR